MDIVFVSYNSEKWIEKCFASIRESDYDLKTVSIYVVDNGSTDSSLEKLECEKEKSLGCLKKFEIIENHQNLGFGKANNMGAQKGTDDIICFLNMDTEVYPDTLSELSNEIKLSTDEFVLWSLDSFHMNILKCMIR